MSLRLSDIKAAKSDEQLFELLSTELNRRLPAEVREDDFVLHQAIQRLSRGLRAMAAVHRLDVSMALDDLGWHFFNYHNLDLCDDTLLGLRELGASEVAEIFQQARSLVEPHWEKIGDLKKASAEDGSPRAFIDWFESSGLETAMLPLNNKFWKICSAYPDHSLLSYWLSYARRYPERVVEETACPC